MKMQSWQLFAASAALAAYSVLLLFTTGCTESLNQNQMMGKELYDIHCASCHEENELGLKKKPPKLDHMFSHQKLPDATIPATDESVRQVIIYGKRTMPAFNGRLTDEQVADLLAYLHKK